MSKSTLGEFIERLFRYLADRACTLADLLDGTAEGIATLAAAIRAFATTLHPATP
ncbi:hypothetical protein [Embleya sp. NPDC005971]|uniref:hypothetical protein n=1 Tax=Embleya sp. NPDC005971 TaxID=3156724 RepID=UPI0034038248